MLSKQLPQTEPTGDAAPPSFFPTGLSKLAAQYGGEALGAGKAFHPKLPPAYDGNRSWSSAALPYRNPCWNTADDPTASFQDGGLPCVPCAIDVEARLFHNVNVSIANDFCEVDAFEDALTVDDALALLRGAHARGAHFYLAVGLHKPHMPWQVSRATALPPAAALRGRV